MEIKSTFGISKHCDCVSNELDFQRLLFIREKDLKLFNNVVVTCKKCNFEMHYDYGPVGTVLVDRIKDLKEEWGIVE